MADLASLLEGKKINGWNVQKKLPTHGGFSSAYTVLHDDGTRAFMKATNLNYAAQSFGFVGSRVDLMHHLLDEFRHERDVLRLCGDSCLDRVVVALDSGEHTEPNSPQLVPYLVFEYCENGDVRSHPKLKNAGLKWRLKVFHGICIGLHQLHSRNIVHQDLKPDNILVFKDDFSKLSDLGGSLKNDNSPRSKQNGHRGDFSFAPPEALYRHSAPDWDAHHKGADLFMLGGLLAFLVADVHLVGLMLSKLPPNLHPIQWQGSYSAALPAVRKAMFDTVEEICATVSQTIRSDVKQLLLWLTEPEPEKRGHPNTVLAAIGNRYALERVISIADRIEKLSRRIP